MAAPDFDVRPLPAKVPPPEENGATFEANAIAKAEYYGQFVDGYLFADDSGLEVDRSRRRAGRAFSALRRAWMPPMKKTMPCCSGTSRAQSTDPGVLSARLRWCGMRNS